MDPLMAWRMHGYQGAAQKKHGHPVLSLLLLVQSDQRVAFLVAEHVVGPLSRTGWVSLSLPHLVKGWPEQTDSPMAEMLRALVPIT